MQDEPRQFTADRGDSGQRLDLVVRRHLADVSSCSRSRVQAWIEDGRVAVNGRRVVRAASRASAGDLVEVLLPLEDRRKPVVAQDAPLTCLFEDEYLLVVNKPAGMVSHPTYRHSDGTLMNALLARAREWPAENRPSLLGRLDKLTSGLVLVAKTRHAHALLQRAWRQPATEKHYLAVVFGRAASSEQQVTLRLRRDPADRRRVVASKTEGVPALTRFRRLAAAQIAGLEVSLLDCTLVTGRMHQIRVHLAASGLPIVGDPVYTATPRPAGGNSGPAILAHFPRQALHAWTIAMDHPLAGTRMQVEATLPADMADLLQACGIEVPTEPLFTSVAKGLRGTGGGEIDGIAAGSASDAVLRPEL